MKLNKWNVGDRLKTQEARAIYIEAALEAAVKDNDIDFLAVAFGDVAKSIGGGDVTAFMSGVATGLKTTLLRTPKAAKPRRLLSKGASSV